MAKSSAKSAPRTPMTTAAAARIQSVTARANGGQVASRSFPARAQAAAAQKGNGGSTGNSGGNA